MSKSNKSKYSPQTLELFGVLSKILGLNLEQFMEQPHIVQIIPINDLLDKIK